MKMREDLEVYTMKEPDPNNVIDLRSTVEKYRPTMKKSLWVWGSFDAPRARETTKELYKYFFDNKVWAEQVDVVENEEGVLRVDVSIKGDWKHDHWAADELMKEKGFTLLDKVVTSDDTGDDSYEAIHKYVEDEGLKRANEYFAQFKESKNKKLKEFHDTSNLYNPILKRNFDYITTKDRWNLKMDIEGFKKQLTTLQNDAAELPDDYVEGLCDSENYPLDDVIDETQSLNAWCNEVDDFLGDSLHLKSESRKRKGSLKENRFYRDDNLINETIIEKFAEYGWEETRDWIGRDDYLTFIKGVDRISFNLNPRAGYDFIYYKNFDQDEYSADYVMYAGATLNELEKDIQEFDTLTETDFLKYVAPKFFIPGMKVEEPETAFLENKKHMKENKMRVRRPLKEDCIREQYFDCLSSGMTILGVATFIEECEENGNVAILTVKTSDGSVQHSQFSLEEWKNYKDAVNGVDEFSRRNNIKGRGIVEVWAKECPKGATLGEAAIFENKFVKKLKEMASKPDQLEVGNLLTDPDLPYKREIDRLINKNARPADFIEILKPAVDDLRSDSAKAYLTKEVIPTIATKRNGSAVGIYLYNVVLAYKDRVLK